MNVKVKSVEYILNELPPFEEINLRGAIEDARAMKFDVIIVLDDDPTGTQTIYDIPVLTNWSINGIRKELEFGTSLFYILTNSRSMPQESADQLALTIGKNIRKANRDLNKSIMVISRGDSTLRGHYPSEVEALEVGLGCTQCVNILIPAFFEGGRFTVGDVHYVKQNSQLIPAAQTAYAKDKVFGYKHSNLKMWVEEKTRGAVSSSEIISFSINELRTQSIASLTQKLNRCVPGTTCVVNATNYQDLQVFTLALLKSRIIPICRTAASFVAALSALPPKPLLTKEQLVQDSTAGGLIIIGSYVPKTTRQLQYLEQNTSLNLIELDVKSMLNAKDEANFLLRQYSDRINDLIQNGEDVVLYTSRALIAANTIKENLLIGTRISGFITDIVDQLKIRPKYLLAKGGITSSDIATKALNVKRAMVKGQVLPGVPVWTLGAESKFEGLSYIIFPGNVGKNDAITHVVKQLGNH
ncbi:MAG: four-carbon acid sugar kinase family protein [Bacteroidota bacterium]